MAASIPVGTGQLKPAALAGPCALQEANSMLEQLIDAASSAEARRTELFEKEALVLQELLNRAWCVMVSQDPHDMADCFCGELTLLELIEKAYTGKHSGFKTRSKLILHADRRLMHHFEVEVWGDQQIVFEDERETSCELAVRSYGLETICRGLVERLKSDFSTQGDLLNYQKRIEAQSSFLIHLEEGFKNLEGHAARQSFKGGERQ